MSLKSKHYPEMRRQNSCSNASSSSLPSGGTAMQRFVPSISDYPRSKWMLGVSHTIMVPCTIRTLTWRPKEARAELARDCLLLKHETFCRLPVIDLECFLICAVPGKLIRPPIVPLKSTAWIPLGCSHADLGSLLMQQDLGFLNTEQEPLLRLSRQKVSRNFDTAHGLISFHVPITPTHYGHWL